jgi:hypothetical protein
MGLLLQAKREAKRLLKLSQENNSAIKISSLSEARKYYAAMKGYHSWHDYEENLKRQEFIKGITPSVAHPSLDIENDELDYYLQDIEFIVHLIEKNEPKINMVENKSHIPSILGKTKNAKRFHQTEDKWLLNSYPCTIIGSTGSGRTECWQSQAQQWVANGEGFIGVDGMGWSGAFHKIYSVAKQLGRTKDIQILNILTKRDFAFDEQRLSNSFDPINPLIGNVDLFKNLFGNEIGEVIHEIALQCKENNMVLDSENIKSILMIKNLINWEKSDIFGKNASEKISYYLQKHLNLNTDWSNLNEDEKDDILFKHLELCKKSKNSIEVIKEYEDLGIFSKNPEINLKEIFLNRKILFVCFPSLEKSWDKLIVIANSIYAQIWKTAIDIEKEMNYKPCFLQNIVLDEVSYSMSASLAEITFKKLPKNSNFIFTFQSFSNYHNNNSITHALSVSKTVVIMKLSDMSDVPLTLKGKIVENAQNNLGVLHKNSHDLKDQREGVGYVYMEVNNSEDQNLSYEYKFNDKNYTYDVVKNKNKLTYKDFINNRNDSYFEQLQLTYLRPENNFPMIINKSLILNKIKSFPLSELNK